jgi:hypothetical protein
MPDAKKVPKLKKRGERGERGKRGKRFYEVKRQKTWLGRR